MKTSILRINPQAPEADRIAEAVRVVRQGGLVIFPTETVYGIAADNSNPAAMARLREVKGRLEGKPFSIMIARKELVRNYTAYDDPALYKLIDRYWPGPLTVIVPALRSGGTIGIRIPDHAVALRLVEDSRCAIAAPSANLEGRPAPTTCEEALRDLDGLVDVAIDSGKVDIGTASTIVDFSANVPRILREGAIAPGDVKDVIGRKHVLFVCTGNSCRSVMAEYLLKKMLKEASDVDVSSAGTGVHFPTGASQETLDVLRAKGCDAADHLSRPVTRMLLQKSDLIFAMTRSHRSQIMECAPGIEKRVYLVGEFSNRPVRQEKDLDIADPIGRGHGEYQECLLSIQDCLERIKGLV